MQIRIIIEHKYSSSHQKQICTYREERKKGSFCINFYKSREKRQYFKNPSKIKGYRYNKHWWARDQHEKLNKKRRGEGRLSLERKGGIETLIRTG